MRYVGGGQRLARGSLIAAAVAFAGFGHPGDWISGAGVPGALIAEAWAKDGQTYLDKAEAYIAKGNFNAAEIELRNAEREAPKDARIRALLGQVYLKLGNFAYAEREARTARDLNGPEADYILTLAEAMMRQGKFADIPVEIKPGNRAPELESKVRVALALAESALRNPTKAEALLREAVSLDPNAVAAKLALARLLIVRNRDEAEKITDEVLTAQPKSADAITLKGEILALRGDADGALQRFDEALTLDPGNIGARLARANLNVNRNDFTALDKDLEVLLKAAPQDFRANYLRALEYVKKQDFAAADKILDRFSAEFCESAGRILCPGSDQIPAEAIWPGRRRDCEIRGAGSEQPGGRAARGADCDGPRQSAMPRWTI